MTTSIFGRILVPHDFSDAADEALTMAGGLASRYGGRLHVLNVLEPVSIPTNVSIPNPTPHLFEFVPKEEQALRERVNRVLGPDAPPASTAVEIGLPFQCILDAAAEADCIVMSTHGRTGLRHLLMGSVAERVVRLSPIPVLTVHPTAGAGTTTRPGTRSSAA